MTCKDYELIASAIRIQYDSSSASRRLTIRSVAESLCNRLKQESMAFDPQKFRIDCGLL